MRKLRMALVIVSFSIVFSASYCSAFEVGSQIIDISASQAFVTRYIWRGQDLYGENDAAHQPSVTISVPKSFFGLDYSLNVWGSFPLSRGHEDAEEIDYTLSASRTVFETLNIAGGFVYFDYPNTASTADVVEPWMSCTFNDIMPALPVEIAAKVFAGYDFQAKSGGPDEGWYYSWGLGTSILLPKCALTQEDQALSLSFTNWGNDGVANLKPSCLYATDLSVATTYAAGKISFTPSINYTMNYEDEINSGNSELWGGITIGILF